MANPILIAKPEKTINSFLSKWNAVSNPMIFTISNDKYPTGATVTNYYTSVEIFVNGVSVGTVNQTPDSNNETKIDVRKYVQTALEYNVSDSNRDTNATAEVYIEGTEEYVDSGGTAQSNSIDDAGSSEFVYASLSAMQFGNEYGGNMYPYVLDSTKTDLAQWMTKFQRGKILDFIDYTISIIANEVPFDVIIEQYDINMNLTTSQTVNIPDEGAGLYRVSLASIVFLSDTTYINLYGDIGGTPVTDSYIIDVDLACSGAPDAPTNLIATSLSFSDIYLEWTSNSNFDETGFSIERSLDGSSFSQIATVGVGVTTYLDSGLSDGTQYYYQVRALGTIPSSNSNIADATTFLDFGLALDSSGINEYIQTGTLLNGVAIDADNWSLSFWINFNGVAPATNGAVFQIGQGSSITRFLSLTVVDDGFGDLLFTLASSGEFVGGTIDTFNINIDSDWHNIVITRQTAPDNVLANLNTVYVDAMVVVNESTNAKNRTPTSYYTTDRVLASKSNAAYLSATIDNFAIIHDYLSQEDVSYIYNNGKGSNFIKNNTETLQLLEFNKIGAIADGDNSPTGTNVGNVSEDSSGNGYDGTLTNFTLTGSTSNYVDSVDNEIDILTATATGTQTVQLDWDYSLIGLPQIASTIEHDTDPNFGSPVSVAMPEGLSSTLITGLTDGAKYYFRIQGAAMTGWFKTEYAYTFLDFGAAFKFDKTQKTAAQNITSILGSTLTDDFTIGFYFKADDSTGTTQEILLLRSATASIIFGVNTPTNAVANRVTVDISNGGTSEFVSLVCDINDTDFHRIIVTRENADVNNHRYRVYIDGLILPPTTGGNNYLDLPKANSIVTVDEFLISQGGGLAIGATIDEVIWIPNKATDTEILNEYNNGKGSNILSDTYTPFTHHKFNEGIPEGNNIAIAAPELLDSSLNGIDLTLFNADKTGTVSNWVDSVD